MWCNNNGEDSLAITKQPRRTRPRDGRSLGYLSTSEDIMIYRRLAALPRYVIIYTL